MHIETSSQSRLDLGFHNHTCNWGTHIAGLHSSPAERDEVLMGFLHAGDQAGDHMLYCPVERSHDEFMAAYAQQFPGEADHPRDPSRFSMNSARDLYYPEGVFSPTAMTTALDSWFSKSQRAGPRNIRATAAMTWACDAIPGIEHLMAYEARLNYFIPGKPWVSICLYDVNRFGGDVIMNVLETHPYTINGGVITENPYYRDPSEWLARNAPEFLLRES